MAQILTDSDFVGEFNIALDSENTTLLDAVIIDTEKKILKNLLGDDLYDAFITGLTESTVKQKWIDLRDGVDYLVYDSTDSNESNYLMLKSFDGVKKMLKYFVWFDYQFKNRQSSFSAGMARGLSSNNNVLENADFGASVEPMYNNGISIYKDAREFITEQNKDTEITSVSTVIVVTPRTKYLDTGDTVTVGGVTYTISTVDEDVSFTTTISVVGSGYWQKYFYPNFKHKEKEYMILGGII